MSAKAGTLQAEPQVSWTGAWIAALMLTAILALSLFAVNRSSGTVEKAPAATRFEVTSGGAGGPSRLAHDQPVGAPTIPGVQIGDTFCHQCR